MKQAQSPNGQNVKRETKDIDRLKAELHWALQTAIESPAERAEAIFAAIEQLRELALRDAEALMLAREEQLAGRRRAR